MTDVAIPVTALYVGVNVLIALALAMLVVRQRFATRVVLGDGGNRALLRAQRVHANNLEYVPLALIMIAVLELMAAPPWLLHGLGATLTVGRLAHAVGLSRKSGRSLGRSSGTVLTWAVHVGGALACLYYAFT